MVKVFVDQVLAIVLPQNFNLASKIIVWAPHQLVFTHISMLLNILAQSTRSALVVTLNDFEKAALVMRL